MNPELQHRLRDFIEANRARALWSWPADYFPDDLESARRVLKRIAARGDRSTFAAAHQFLRELG